jgi:hypothetical protein
MVPDRTSCTEKLLTARPARSPLRSSNPNAMLVRYQDGDSESSLMAALKNGFSRSVAVVMFDVVINAM